MCFSLRVFSKQLDHKTLVWVQLMTLYKALLFLFIVFFLYLDIINQVSVSLQTRDRVNKQLLRKTAVLMTSGHKKEFMLLFLNIALVSSQIMQLICSKTLFFSEKYVTVSF